MYSMYTGHIAHIRHTQMIYNSFFGSTLASVDLISKSGKLNVV